MQVIKIRANNYQRITDYLRNSVGTFLKSNWNLKEIRKLFNKHYDSVDDLAHEIVFYNGFVMKPAHDRDALYLAYLAETNDNREIPYTIVGEIPYAVIIPSNEERYEFVSIDDDFGATWYYRV